MFIMNGMGTEIINTDYVERFLLVQKEDAVLINANMPSKPVVIGRYAEGKRRRPLWLSYWTRCLKKTHF